jgi:hypothetical protein
MSELRDGDEATCREKAICGTASEIRPHHCCHLAPPKGNCNFIKQGGIAACQRCGDILDNPGKKLSELQVGQLDGMASTVREICWQGQHYIVYRSDTGVSVHFSDCHAIQQRQRQALLDISAELCQLRFLASQMSSSHLGNLVRNKTGKASGFYDHEIAQALVLSLEGNSQGARNILEQGHHMAVERVTNENRIRYLLACYANAVLLSFAIAVFAYFGSASGLGDAQCLSKAHPYMLAAGCGVAGAVFSLSMRVYDFALTPCQQSVMNYWMGGLRVFIGFTAALVLLLLFNASTFGDAMASVLGGEKKLFAQLSSATWHYIALVGFLAGFAERLVPTLLKKREEEVYAEARERRTRNRKQG